VTSVISFQVGESPTFAIRAFNFAPLYIDSKVEEFQNLVMLSSKEESHWNWHAEFGFEYFIGQHILHITALVLGVFSLFITVSRFFAFDGMAKVGKKFRLIAALLWSISVISHFCSMAWLMNEVFKVEMLVTNVFQWSHSIEAGLGYFNLGLSGAILSSMLLFASWLNPKPILIPTIVENKRFQSLKCLLKVPERERIPAILLAASIATFFFFLVYNLPFVTWVGSFLTYFIIFLVATASIWIFAGYARI